DPMLDALGPLKISAESARPLLQEFAGPKGRVVSSDLLVTDPKGTHPIAGTMQGIVTRIPWPIPMKIADDHPGTVTPFIVVDNAGGTIWAESDWLGFRQTPPAQRQYLANPPAKDSSRDDGDGPWNLGVAVDRFLPGNAARQRMVVVGSNGWFLDD